MERILCVDDDPNVLSAYRRQLRKQYDLVTAEGAEQALELLDGEDTFAVAVADMRMPRMDGVELLGIIRERSPQTVRMMLTGNADMQTAIDAVNEGEVFRFLCKPCPPEQFAKALDAGLEQYRLANAERELLQETLVGIVETLGDLLSVANPIAFGRASRVRQFMGKVARKLGVKEAWEYEVAGLLSQIGALTLPAIILEKVQQGKVLSPEEQSLFDAHPQIGRDLIAHVPRFEPVAEMIGLQEERVDESGAPVASGENENISLGAKALHAVLDFDTLVTSGKSWHEALAEIQRAGEWYDESVVRALEEVTCEEMEYEVREVGVQDLKRGMILDEDLKSVSGKVLHQAKGQPVTLSLRAWINNFSAALQMREPVRVRIPIEKNE